MTGEDGELLTVTSVGTLCTITGYPAVRFLANDSPIPFTYVLGQGQYVTHRRPEPVTVGHGRAAYLLIAKYRCDLGVTESATGQTLLLPWQGTTFTPPVGWFVAPDYCKGGAHDPGNTVEVSPFEPAASQVFAF